MCSLFMLAMLETRSDATAEWRKHKHGQNLDKRAVAQKLKLPRRRGNAVSLYCLY
jgi:hypothetical protein